jgi:hypothetical protein
LVEEPFSLSVKVWPSMEEGDMLSEKVAVTSVAGATPVAFAAGTVLTTVGDFATPRR